MAEKEHRPIAQIVREEFLGPVTLKMIPATSGEETPARYPEATRLVAVDRDEVMALMDLEEMPIIFPVGAFIGKVGKRYDCYVRFRPSRQPGKRGIIEAIPENWEALRRTGEWDPKAQPPNFEIVFTKNEAGQWECRHPATGQYIQPFGVDLTPGPDGKVHIQDLWIRRATTRTFLVMGPPEVVKRARESAIEHYKNHGETKEFSYAPQFSILGHWWDPISMIGDPTAGPLLDLDWLERDFSKEYQERIKTLQRWLAKNALPSLHPDRINLIEGLTAKELERALSIAEETRNNIIKACDWYELWAEHMLSELRQRRAAGRKPVRPIVPQPYGRRARQLMTTLSRHDFEKMLMAAIRPPKRKKPVKPTPAAKPAAPKAAAPKPTPKREARPEPKAMATIGELAPGLADLAGKGKRSTRRARKTTERKAPARKGRRQKAGEDD